MCVVLVLVMSYFQRHPSKKKIPEPPQAKTAQIPALQSEDIKKLHTGFKAQTEILSKQQLAGTQPDIETTSPAIGVESVPIIAATKAPYPQTSLDADYSALQARQQKDELKKQQEDLRRQQEALKQQFRKY
jgi:hypothetical protein